MGMSASVTVSVYPVKKCSAKENTKTGSYPKRNGLVRNKIIVTLYLL